MRLTGYRHFVQLAESLQWDETTIDLSADVEAWGRLTETERTQLSGLLCGFCVAEAAVSEHLVPFQGAASVDDSMREAFRSQARDEARHARFFDRVAHEVLGAQGDGPRERLDALRSRVSPDLVELFEHRLPAIARRVAEGSVGVSTGVGLYHMVLEGVVLLAGQNALLDSLTTLSVPMQPFASFAHA